MVERANGSIKKIIAKTITELTSVNWSVSAPAAGYAYNPALHRSTGFAPFFLMFGRDVKTPLDVLLTSDNTSPSVTPLTDYLLHLLRSIRTSHRVVTDSLLAEDKARIASNSAHTPGKAQTISYEIGDLVLWTNLLPDTDEPEKKWSPIWRGPFTITDKFGSTTYELNMSANRGDSRIASAHQLKRYHCVDDAYLPDTDPPKAPLIPESVPTSKVPSAKNPTAVTFQYNSNPEDIWTGDEW